MEKFGTARYQKMLNDIGELGVENLFGFLGKVQDTFGYVPREVIEDTARRTGLSPSRIYGALTSYRDFNLKLEGDG